MSNMEINLKYFKTLAFLALTLTTYTAQENDTSVFKNPSSLGSRLKSQKVATR
ncbi:hypothetical protein O8H67_000394 [Enterobacter asburiae]|nr:hypothetical protein [Enterobacter asburiae]